MDKIRSLQQRIVSTAAVMAALGLTCMHPAALAAPAAAPDPIQREDLALINAQLTRIDRVVNRLARREARQDPKSQRVILDVAALRADIATIRAGINAYLSPPRAMPRHLGPLNGDYAKRETPGGRR